MCVPNGLNFGIPVSRAGVFYFAHHLGMHERVHRLHKHTLASLQNFRIPLTKAPEENIKHMYQNNQFIM